MENSQKIRICNANNLYSILPKELIEEFSIGMHEFREGEYWGRPEELFGKWSEDTVRGVKESILSNGLTFSKYSRLLSTVSFSNDLSSYIDGECSKLGGVIIALPKVLRSESGKEMFVGSPNENSRFNKNWSRRETATSLSDFILPEEGLLDPMFVIGTYEMTDNGIEFTANPNHIAFNRGKVPDEFFEEALGRLRNILRSDDYNPEEIEAITKETVAQQQKYRGEINPSTSLDDEIGVSRIEYAKENQEAVRDEIKTMIEDMRLAGFQDSEIQKSIIEELGISDMDKNSEFIHEMETQIEELMRQPQEQEQELEDTSVSLTELGKKSYQHFGRKIAEKLKGTIDMLKSKFFSKDKEKSTDTYTAR